MTQINTVADIRSRAQLSPEDRRAIRRSIAMALLGLAAAITAVLLAPIDEGTFSGRAGTAPSTAPIVSPAAAPQPTEAMGNPSRPELITPPGEKIEPPLD